MGQKRKSAQRRIPLSGFSISNDNPMVIIAGPCVIESEKLAMSVAIRLKEIARRLKIPFIFKSSYDKANRTSVQSFRGPGLREGIDILGRIKERVGVPVLTDVHSLEEIRVAAEIVDVLQIPAFLCRQTDMLLEAGRTGKVVNVKKGQFLSPWEMKNILEKIESTGNKKVFLTERGSSFGYNNLVVDMKGLEIMKTFGCPVIYDATHSVQLPGGRGTSSGGQREFLWPLARAAVAIGVAGVFMEVHPNPDKALSDGPNSAKLSEVPDELRVLKSLDQLIKH